MKSTAWSFDRLCFVVCVLARLAFLSTYANSPKRCLSRSSRRSTRTDGTPGGMRSSEVAVYLNLSVSISDYCPLFIGTKWNRTSNFRSTKVRIPRKQYSINIFMSFSIGRITISALYWTCRIKTAWWILCEEGECLLGNLHIPTGSAAGKNMISAP